QQRTCGRFCPLTCAQKFYGGFCTGFVSALQRYAAYAVISTSLVLLRRVNFTEFSALIPDIYPQRIRSVRRDSSH
ncbi:hypothetical protein EDD18DRAFT_1331790, partial [Armillaria luteobubalina]